MSDCLQLLLLNVRRYDILDPLLFFLKSVTLDKLLYFPVEQDFLLSHWIRLVWRRRRGTSDDARLLWLVVENFGPQRVLTSFVKINLLLSRLDWSLGCRSADCLLPFSLFSACNASMGSSYLRSNLVNLLVVLLQNVLWIFYSPLHSEYLLNLLAGFHRVAWWWHFWRLGHWWCGYCFLWRVFLQEGTGLLPCWIRGGMVDSQLDLLDVLVFRGNCSWSELVGPFVP